MSVEVHVKLVIYFYELFPDLPAHLSHRAVLAIIFQAIVKGQVDVIYELLHPFVVLV
jgi:hypothetical protein